MGTKPWHSARDPQARALCPWTRGDPARALLAPTPVPSCSAAAGEPVPGTRGQVGVQHLPARRHRCQEGAGASTPGLTKTEAEQDESGQGLSELCQHWKKSQ